MTINQHGNTPNLTLNALDTIYQRRAIRDYLPQKINQDIINALLNAAVHAPTAMHEEPWAFGIIQNQAILNRLSDSTIAKVRKAASDSTDPHSQHALDLVNKPGFHVFYNASTLIVIYSKLHGEFVTADCWLAAENLMLAACTMQLGTCVIGFSVETLNSTEWKAELGIPDNMMAIAPIIVGVPKEIPQPTPRKQPDIIVWK